MEIIEGSGGGNRKNLSGCHTKDMGEMGNDTQQEKERADHITMRQRIRKPMRIMEGWEVEKRRIGPNRIQKETKNTKSSNR